MWNDMPGNIKLCKSMFTVIFFTKLYFCNLINLVRKEGDGNESTGEKEERKT